MMNRLGVALLTLLLAVPTLPRPGLAEDAARTARDAALQLLDAIEGLAEAQGAEDQVPALTETIRAHEGGLAAVRAGLSAIEQREGVVSLAFEAQSGAVSQLLAAMVAVSRVEGPALLAHPAGAVGTIRAGMLMADMVPAMQSEADRIGAHMAEIQALRTVRAEAEGRLTAGLSSLHNARDELARAIAERREPPPPLGQDEARLLALLQSAQTLEVLSTGLGSLLQGDDRPAPGFDLARGSLPLPVRGQVLEPVGPPDIGGTIRPSLVLSTEPGALVTAPFAGTLRYQGSLSDYGNVILLEPGAGYLLLIAGLDAVYVDRGDTVPAGAPLGLMPGTEVASEGEAAGTGDRTGDRAGAGEATRGRDGPRLYLELRHRGQAIDPSDWFDLTGATP